LAQRSLISKGNPNRSISSEYIATQATYEATDTIAIATLPSALPEFVFTILRPLYELFHFFQLPKQVVTEELASLLRNRFYP